MPLVPSSFVGCTTKYVLSCLFLLSLCFGSIREAIGQIPSDPTNPTKRPVASEKQINSDLKLLLSDYYTGKPVRAKIVIPANERGIEVLDGQLKIYPLPEVTAAVQPGELVLIKELRFKNKEIEVRFEAERLQETTTAAPPLAIPGLAPVGPHGSDATVGPPSAALVARTGAKSSRPLPDPRVVLRFSREIETRDLNLQSINRLLAPAVEVMMLSPIPLSAPTTTATSRPTASERAQQTAVEQGIQVAPVTGDLVGASAGVGELVIECSVPGVRLYIDGTFSGTAPRTVQLMMGVHTVLVVAPGQRQFEQKFFLPAGKVSTIQAEFNQK